jgi:hypothetical protein
VREAKPKIWPISRFRTRTHSIVEGSSRKTPIVSKKPETWKILGRTLRLPPYWPQSRRVAHSILLFFFLGKRHEKRIPLSYFTVA